MKAKPKLKKEEYKKTELGLFPNDWKVFELRDNIIIETGKRMKGGALKKGEVPSLGGQHLDYSGRVLWDKDTKYISKEFYKSMKQGKVYKEDVLVVKDGATTGKTAYVKELPFKFVAVNEHVFILRPFDENLIMKPFLFYYLLSIQGHNSLRKNYRGLIGGIGREDIKEIKIPLPPKTEQKKINYILSIIQQDKEKTENMINSIRELKKSLMKHLFKYGSVKVEEAEKVKLKETEIGEISEKWNLSELKDIIETTQYGLSLRSNPKDGHPILGMSHLINGKVRISGIKYVNLDNKTYKKYKVNKNDILFNRTNSIDLVGKTSLFDLDFDCVFASYLIRVVVKNKIIDSGYLNYYMNLENTQNNLKKLATRAVGQSNISATRLKTLIIPLPPLSIQKKIASILSAVDEKIEKLENKKVAIEELFKSMLQELMTAKRRVNDLEVGNG